MYNRVAKGTGNAATTTLPLSMTSSMSSSSSSSLSSPTSTSNSKSNDNKNISDKYNIVKLQLPTMSSAISSMIWFIGVIFFCSGLLYTIGFVFSSEFDGKNTQKLATRSGVDNTKELHSSLPHSSVDSNLPRDHHQNFMLQELHRRLDYLETTYSHFKSKEKTGENNNALNESDQSTTNYNLEGSGELVNIAALQKKVKILENEKTILQKKVEDQMYHHLEHHTGNDITMPWLIIGIPTIGRKDNKISYLGETISNLLDPLPVDPTDPMFNKVHLVIVNNHYLASDSGSTSDNDIHVALEEQKAKYKYPHPKSQYITFFENDDNLEDPLKKQNAGNANKPGFKVRKQTRDIASTMKRANLYFQSLNNKENNNKSRQSNSNTYFLFLEDDMKLCEHGYLAMYYMLRKAELYHPNFLALRASFGMNGLFFHASDISVFADYLLEHQARRPPDHLAVEWFAGEKPQSKEYKGNRPHVAFRYNLFYHLGVHSSLRSVDQTTFPYCYEPLGEPILFKVEAYDPIACPEDDIWPCKPTNHEVGYLMDKKRTDTLGKLLEW